MIENKKDIYEEILYIIFLFFVGALIGGLAETVFVYLMFNKFYIGGFMYGPWRPIYGLGCLLLYLITKKIKGNDLKVFLSCAIICSVFEYLSSVILEIIFNKRWWDYSNVFLNLNGRICLIISIIWGVVGLIFLKKLEPFVRKVFQNITIKKKKNFLTGLVVLYLIDHIFSWLNNINYFLK